MARRALHPLFGLLISGASPCHAQPSNGYGWATIDHAGNRGATAEESYRGSGFGSVGYDYRISRTETTNAQWVRFLEDYLPFYQGDINFDIALTGWRVAYGADGRFHIAPGAENVACEVGWRSAALYCNWMSNGMVSEAWAFRSGAYDASTFTENPDGSRNDAPTHQAGAAFWLPTVDEWAKAAWYDPNRYGPGREGYWWYMNGTNTPLVSGLPGTGAETSAGVGVPDDIGAFPVGVYGALGPWGMCDLSGSAIEWTEGMGPLGRYRKQYGSYFQDTMWVVKDLAQLPGQMNDAALGLAGFRLATVVPAPGAAASLSATGLIVIYRRKNRAMH